MLFQLTQFCKTNRYQNVESFEQEWSAFLENHPYQSESGGCCIVVEHMH